MNLNHHLLTSKGVHFKEGRWEAEAGVDSQSFQPIYPPMPTSLVPALIPAPLSMVAGMSTTQMQLRQGTEGQHGAAALDVLSCT